LKGAFPKSRKRETFFTFATNERQIMMENTPTYMTSTCAGQRLMMTFAGLVPVVLELALQ